MDFDLSRRIKPKGKIINDHYEGHDHLDANHYAGVLAKSLRQVQTPLTVGILSGWGSGKTYLLDSIREKLKDDDNDDNDRKSRKCSLACSFGFLILLSPILLIIYTMVGKLVLPKYRANLQTTSEPTTPIETSIFYTFIIACALVLLFLFIFTVSGFKKSKMFLTNTSRRRKLGAREQLKLFFVCFFTKVPGMNEKHLVDGHVNDSDYDVKLYRYEECPVENGITKRNFISVHFNAWEHMGCDKTWAAIITKLTDEMEAHFGKIFCRLFRELKLQFFFEKTKSRKPFSLRQHLTNHRSYYLGISKIAWVALFMLFVPLFVAAICLNVDVFSSKKVKWTLIITSGFGVLLGVFKFLYLFINSQRKRIKSALKGIRADISNELGFMQKIKREVKVIEVLIGVVEFVIGEEYKILITVDDLDRIPHTKIKPILDAMNLLLSDYGSPFISLIAVDPRIAVKSVESELGPSLIRANITGYEYLRKIINLPFCIPKLDESKKRRFMSSLFLESHEATLGDPDQGDQGAKDEVLSEAQFLYECSFIIASDNVLRWCVGSNPRSIKRLYNVVSLTSLLVNSYDRDHQLRGTYLTKNFAKPITYWITLCEVWPYRISLMLYICELGEENFSDDQIKSLSDVYKQKVKPQLFDLHVKKDDDPSLLSLDGSDKQLEMFLDHIKKKMAPTTLLQVLKDLLLYTINLDYTLYEGIVVDKTISDLQQKNFEYQTKTVVKSLAETTLKVKVEGSNPMNFMRIDESSSTPNSSEMRDAGEELMSL